VALAAVAGTPWACWLLCLAASCWGAGGVLRASNGLLRLDGGALLLLSAVSLVRRRFGGGVGGWRVLAGGTVVVLWAVPDFSWWSCRGCLDGGLSLWWSVLQEWFFPGESLYRRWHWWWRPWASLSLLRAPLRTNISL
jgi:hypothetical protein